VHAVAGGATSVASSPNTAPIRPPLATSQTDTPPQWSTVANVPSRFSIRFTQSWSTRVATCGLSRPTKRGERSVAKLIRDGTTVVSLYGTTSPSRARKLGLSK
jgi:hypothetical protein